MAAALAALGAASPAGAATVYVPKGANLQTVLNAAKPGDVILLAEGAEFVGNFVLPHKSGEDWITLRSATPDTVLPIAGQRIRPADAPLLARLRSPNSIAALRTAARAHHWDIRYIEFAHNQNGYGDIIQIGDGSSAQNTIERMPHHIVLSHLYVHGHPVHGQKRGIALNGAYVTIRDSYISECKAVGQDAQALGGWNGAGPYLIENNYFEASGENVLFGGADPAIAGLVPDGITFRRNYLSRPMSWKNAIIGTPVSVTASEEQGGGLTPGVYSYRIIARGPSGQGSKARSAASAETVVTVTRHDAAVRLEWPAVAGATEYRVYGRTSGALTQYWKVTTPEFVDVGLTGSAEKVPTSAGTMWAVKNIFELKNARNVLIEDNIFENHWKESQPGYAILFTPRNSNGSCSWCVVEHVRFEYNVVRNVAAAVNLTGQDIPARPTRQSNHVAFRHNLFTGLRTSLGGNAWFMLLGDSPRDIVIAHNTIDSNGSTLVNVYGGTAAAPDGILGFEMTANAARHGSYGMNGSFFSYGNGILHNFYPGAVFVSNYLAGGPASRYPAGNFFTGTFESQFVDAAAGNFTVRDGSILRGAAGGEDIGVNYAELSRRVAGVESGDSFDVPEDRDPPSAAFSWSCSFLQCTFADTSAEGSAPIASATWNIGPEDTEPGAAFVHTFAAAGTYAVTLTIVDLSGRSSSVTESLYVEPANIPPTAAFSANCLDLQCAFMDASADNDGSIVDWDWSFDAAGAASGRSPTFNFAVPGTYTITLTATDDDGAVASRTVSVQVTAMMHVSIGAGTTTRWGPANSTLHYWSADIEVQAHGADERLVAGVTITAAWTGAVTKSASCVTGSNGRCTFKSGTLSMHRQTVTLTMTSLSAPHSQYVAAGNHRGDGGGAGAVTLTKP